MDFSSATKNADIGRLSMKKEPADIPDSYPSQSLDDFLLTPAQRARIEARAEARRRETQGMIEDLFSPEHKEHWDP